MKARNRVAVCVGGLLVGTVALGGCFLVADLDRFHAAEAPDGGVDDPNLPSALSLTMLDMGFHYNQMIEFRVIDNQNRIQSRGFIEPLDKPGTIRISVTIPNAIPPENGPYRLDFYGDMNDSGTYDGIGDLLTQDHAWRIEPLVDYPVDQVTHRANVVQVLFKHNAVLTDIDRWPSGGALNPVTGTGLGARVRFNGQSLAQWKGKLAQLRIAEVQTGHVVGLYRNPSIPEGDFEAKLPGVLDPGTNYYLELYIDANGNGVYDNPAAVSPDSDVGWRIPIKAGDGMTDGGPDASPGAAEGPYGVDYAFDAVNEPNSNKVDVGPP